MHAILIWPIIDGIDIVNPFLYGYRIFNVIIWETKSGSWFLCLVFRWMADKWLVFGIPVLPDKSIAFWRYTLRGIIEKMTKKSPVIYWFQNPSMWLLAAVTATGNYLPFNPFTDFSNSTRSFEHQIGLFGLKLSINWSCESIIYALFSNLECFQTVNGPWNGKWRCLKKKACAKNITTSIHFERLRLHPLILVLPPTLFANIWYLA